MSQYEPWFEGQVALVTGAGGGIGMAVSELLAKRGATVVVSDAIEQGVERAQQALAALGKPVLGVLADVGDAASAERLVQQAVDQFGRVDILVNNAGITRDSLLMRMKDDAWDSVLRVNLTGTFLCSRAAQKPMLRQKSGRIISIASVVGIMGNAGQANYAASKAGVIGFTKSLARELASRGITVNAVAPGYISTPMTDALSEAQREAVKAKIPLGVFGQPADVAGAVAFLASEMARYITGQVIVVDGGMAM